ncbi:MAG: cell division protein FtsW [Clostridia bacterium]|nr:cell division protein FtsW [Clostridia bacterium]
MNRENQSHTAHKKSFSFGRSREEKRDAIYRGDTLHEPQRDEALPSKGIVDVPFLLITVALVLFGCVMVYSASSVFAEKHHDDNTYFIARHLLFLLMAVAFTAVAVRFCTPRFWKDFSYVLYGVSVVLLLLVLVIGDDLDSGAKRWLNFGFITVQPSEIAKIALVLTMARFMSTHEKKILSEHKFGGSFQYGVLYPGLMIACFIGLVAAERHISGIMIIGMIGISVMFLGGTRLRWILLIGGVVACAGCLLILVSEYAQARVDTWINIEDADPLGSAWQTLQGLMAIGSGGLFGTGLGNSRQKFGYVSQPQNDFIFTIVCEELGFIGAILVVGLFVAYVWRGFYIARHAPDKFTALTVYGLTFKVAVQVILNIAVVTNSMPNTGIALPFFSYGGTALMLQIFEVGIILSISRYASHKKI